LPDVIAPEVIAPDPRDHQALTICAAVVLILALRMACLGGLRPPLRLPLRLLSGLWLGFALWTVGAVLQAWVPLWEVLLLGVAVAATLAALPERIGAQSRATADFVTVAALGPMSVIPVGIPSVIGAAVAFAAAGFALDRWARRMPAKIQWKLLALPAVLLLLLGVSAKQVGDFDSRLLAQDPLFVLRLALVVPDPGASLSLQHGIGAWILRTPADRPQGTAILLHGNDPRASWQPAALALQGSLLRAGYDVLSVDHAGYGATPAPDVNADWSAWDPTIGPKQAFRYLRSAHARAPTTIVVGHSMGVDVALQWLSDGADVQAEYLFGGSIDRPTGSENDWIGVFHQQRHMRCCIPLQTMRTVRDRFYSGADHFARVLPGGHAMVHFVRFGIEYADVTQDREPLYADIPAPKMVHDFAGVTHYFNTLSLRGGFVLLDTLTVQRTAAIFLHPPASPRSLLQATACGEHDNASSGSRHLAPAGC
jgi:pimeloyl-ACP methyl ester carboxylesterase